MTPSATAFHAVLTVPEPGMAVPGTFEGYQVGVTWLEESVAALTLPGCEDMLSYFRLAQLFASPLRPALLVTCLPEYQHQASWVVRVSGVAHAFRPPPPNAAPISTPQHFAGAHESWVKAPIAEGLAFSGLASRVAAERVCQLVGHHAH